MNASNAVLDAVTEAFSYSTDRVATEGVQSQTNKAALSLKWWPGIDGRGSEVTGNVTIISRATAPIEGTGFVAASIGLDSESLAHAIPVASINSVVFGAS